MFHEKNLTNIQLFTPKNGPKPLYNRVMSEKPLLIVSTTDVHGTISAYAYHDRLPKPYGLSRFSSALKSYQNQEILLVDNGDSLQGSPLLTYSHQIEARPVILAKIFNTLKLNYVNLGNHDFNYGMKRLCAYLEDLDAQCITSNVYYQGNPLGQTHIYVSNDHQRIGLIGVVTDYIPHWEKPDHLKDVEFLDPFKVVQSELQKLLGKVDRICVFYHGGLERDLTTGLATETLNGENVGYQLAQLEGIDVLVTGHQHRSILTKHHAMLISQCSLNAQEVVEIQLGTDITGQLVSLAPFEIDQTIENAIEPLQSETQTWLDQSVGTLVGPSLRIDDPFQARLHKHPLVSFINQVQMDVSHAQLSATALFNQPYGLNPQVSYRDLVSTYIYPNSLVVKDLTGSILKAYLEKCAEYFVLDNSNIQVNPAYDEPKPQHFNYDMIDGIDYTLDISRPIGQRLTRLLYQNHDVKDEDHLSVVMNNYRAAGGGDFSMIASAPTLLEIQDDMVEIMAAYLRTSPITYIQHTENIRITNGDK